MKASIMRLAEARQTLKSLHRLRQNPKSAHAVRSHPDPWPLWGRYQQCKAGSALEEEIVQKSLPSVTSIVRRIAITLPSSVDSQDLYSAGLVGLLNAVRNFHPRHGASFGTYARLRIRGAVFDELRRMDWVPRSVHARARKVRVVLKELEEVKGRVPTDSDMAKSLKISVPEYQGWLLEIRPATYLCLDAKLHFEDDEDSFISESFADEHEDILSGASRKEMIRLIGDQLTCLLTSSGRFSRSIILKTLRLREIAQVFE
jgi:RNA polymerase sigma factor for flagellar operon FliA